MIRILWESLTTKYFQYSGRSSRKEYCFFWLLQLIGGNVVFFIIKNNEIFGLKIVYLSIFILFLFLLPSITVSVRRLHDFNFNGWWFLIIILFDIWINDFFNNFIGGFIITNITHFIIGIIKGTSGTNKYGEEPKN